MLHVIPKKLEQVAISMETLLDLNSLSQSRKPLATCVPSSITRSRPRPRRSTVVCSS
jgi:hypothetical protein